MNMECDKGSLLSDWGGEAGVALIPMRLLADFCHRGNDILLTFDTPLSTPLGDFPNQAG